MIQRQVILSNLLISYYQSSSLRDAAKTVVFLHGWRSNSQVWLAVIKLLEKDDYQIFALDLPGFGGSQIPPQSWKSEDYAKVVREFIAEFNLRNVCVVGHSFGGKVAIKLAADYPESLQKLVLVNSSGIRIESWKNRLIILLAKIVKLAFAIPILKSLRPRIYKILGTDDYLATPELKSTFLNVVREDFRTDLAKIRHRTLIIWGDLDRETPLVLGQMMVKFLPHASLIVIPKTGHFSFLEKPEEFVKHLLKFLYEPI